MTAYVDGQPVANISLANTWNEWISMTNQILSDGHDTANTLTDDMVSESAVLQHLSREYFDMANSDSPSFAGVSIDWSKLPFLDQPLETSDNLTANVITFSGNVGVGGSDYTGARLTVDDSEAIYLIVGSNSVVVRSGDGIRLDDQVLISSTNNFVFGKLGIGTTTPNNNLEVVGDTDANNVYDSNNLVYSPANQPTANDVGLSEVLNEEQVPASGGTFTGNVEFQQNVSILEDFIIDGFVMRDPRFNVRLIENDPYRFYVGSEEGTPSGLFFNPDGLQMFIVGQSNLEVYEYTLTTAWDISTASYANNSFDVSSEDGFMNDVLFKPDGTKMYTIGSLNSSIYEYNLGSAWDITTASYANSSFTIDDNTPTGGFFKPDGESLFIVGDSDDTIYQYSLSTPWEVSSTSNNGSFDISSEITGAQGISFNIEGNRVFIPDFDTNSVYQYDLSTPWDITTATYNGGFFSGTDDAPRGFFVSREGTKLYIAGSVSDDIFEYSMNRLTI